MSGKAPNILFLMSDQMGAPVLPIHGHPVCQAPHIEALADSGVVFDSAYSNYPLCAPARFSMLAGRLTPAIGAFDNTSEFTADTPTLAHYLTLLGYRTEDALHRPRPAPRLRGAAHHRRVSGVLLLPAGLGEGARSPTSTCCPRCSNSRATGATTSTSPTWTGTVCRRCSRATGGEPYWAYKVREGDDRRFVRNAGAAPTKAKARFPYVEPVPFEQ